MSEKLRVTWEMVARINAWVREWRKLSVTQRCYHERRVKDRLRIDISREAMYNDIAEQ